MKYKSLILPVIAMAIIVVASNILVQYPLAITIGGYNLADILTWGAFSYPVAFLVTDLTNRSLGAAKARIVVIIGFVIAVLLSVKFAAPRIAIASGSAFLVAQLLDISVFNRLRQLAWWRAPLTSSVVGSSIDTAVFFSLAFAASFAFLGPNIPFLIEQTPVLGLLEIEAPRWVSLALGDLAVKMLVALAMLIPYGALRSFVGKFQPA